MNCPFDCEYCYLKGMYQTPYTVVFVNFEDYAEEVRDRLRSGTVICAFLTILTFWR